MIVFGKFQTFLICILCAILHEMGHSFVGRKLGYKLNMITLMPYGAMLSGKNATFLENDEIKIAVAGPIVNALLILIFISLWWVFPVTYNFTLEFVLANIYTLCFNLLPVYPLDGGRVMLAVLSKNMNRTRAYKLTRIVGFLITGIVFLLFFVSCVFKLNYMLGINALFLLIGLLGGDTDAYYKKLQTFDKFSLSFKKKKIILNCDAPIFEAYKKIVEQNATYVEVIDKEIKKSISKNQILEKILNVPLDTKLSDINC